MALFTDGNPSAIEDLRTYESSLLDVAKVEQIDLEGKLALSTGEVAEEVIAFLLRRATQDPQAATRRALGLKTVVVSDSMKRWHTLHALGLVFADAYNNQLNDRYKGKRAQYEALAERAKRQALEYGIGLVGTPIPRAMAPVFANASGAGVATAFYVSASWVGVAEGAPSFVTTFDTAAGSLLAVSVNAPPAGVTGWNVYVGLTRDSMAKQNATPLALNATWVNPAEGLSTGLAPGKGQNADFWVVEHHSLIRG